MDETLPRFVYDPLPPQHIRILHLSAHSDSAKEAGSLICSLETIPFPNDSEEIHTPFEALSYAWGSLEKTYPLICDGKEIRIHLNLHEALPYLACRPSSLPIWIDAVCINQSDEKEKVQQIRLMSKIFSGAERVWAWLGPAGEPAAQEAVDEILPRMEAAKKKALSLPPGQQLLTEELDLLELKSLAWDAFIDIVNSPWFSRLWVIQEACLAKELRILYGTYELDHRLLEDACRSFVVWFTLHDGSHRLPSRTFKGKTVIFRSRGAYQSKRWEHSFNTSTRAPLPSHISDIMLSSLDSECSDPKDRVLGLLGLLDNDAADLIQLSEGCTTVYLYTQLIAIMITSQRRHQLLWHTVLYLAIGSRSENSPLPSWCPDFHACKDSGRYLPTVSWNNTFQASLRERALAFNESLLEMHSHGIIVDTVSVPGPGFPEYITLIPESFLKFVEWEVSVRSLCLSNLQHADPSQSNERAATPQDVLKVFVAEEVDGTRYTPESFDTLIELTELARNDPATLYAVLHQSALDYGINQRHFIVTDEKKTIAKEWSTRLKQNNMRFLLTQISSVQEPCTTFSTTNGRFGFSNGRIKPGDQVVIFDGAQYPYMIRRCPGDREVYQLIGVVYLRGMMRGEVEDLGLERREIILV